VKKGPEGEADTVVSFYDETDVNVSPMTEKEIREYADSEEPMDKAGSYAVQGFFARYIDGFKGILRECDGTFRCILYIRN